VPLSTDPQRRANQLANLKSTNAVKHGANSEALVRPMAERYSVELREQFPDEGDWWIKLMGRRLAKIERRAVYCEGRREVHQRRGTVIPAAKDEEDLTRAFLADLDRAEQRKREAGRTSGPTLADVEQELLAAGDQEGEG
jgi:hypothetical protein